MASLLGIRGMSLAATQRPESRTAEREGKTSSETSTLVQVINAGGLDQNDMNGLNREGLTLLRKRN